MNYKDSDTVASGTQLTIALVFDYITFTEPSGDEFGKYLSADTYLQNVSVSVGGFSVLGPGTGLATISALVSGSDTAGSFKAQVLQAIADMNANRTVPIFNPVITSVTDTSGGLGLNLNPNGFSLSTTLVLVSVAVVGLVGVYFYKQAKEIL